MVKISREQQLINIMFEVAFLARENETLKKMDRDKFAAWIRSQLEGCGFHTVPMGCLWGVLTTKTTAEFPTAKTADVG